MEKVEVTEAINDTQWDNYCLDISVYKDIYQYEERYSDRPC